MAYKYINWHTNRLWYAMAKIAEIINLFQVENHLWLPWLRLALAVPLRAHVSAFVALIDPLARYPSHEVSGGLSKFRGTHPGSFNWMISRLVILVLELLHCSSASSLLSCYSVASMTIEPPLSTMIHHARRTLLSINFLLIFQSHDSFFCHDRWSLLSHGSSAKLKDYEWFLDNSWRVITGLADRDWAVNDGQVLGSFQQGHVGTNAELTANRLGHVWFLRLDEFAQQPQTPSTGDSRTMREAGATDAFFGGLQRILTTIKIIKYHSPS